MCLSEVVKFTRKDNEEEIIPEEYVPTYISLGRISDSLNGVLVGDYSITSSVSGNSLVIGYGDDSISVPMVGNELMVTMEEDNKDVITGIYKEIASIICVYYGNEDKYCKNTLDTMSDSGNDGIRIVGDNVYIDTTKSYTVNTEIVYNDVTKVNVNETGYVLSMLDTRVYNINVVSTDSNIVISGNIDRTNDDTSNVSVNVKLYDKDSNVIGDNKYEFNESNVLEVNGTFEVTFAFSDDLKLENIDTYSIEIVK